jgi:hypothetical protein
MKKIILLGVWLILLFNFASASPSISFYHAPNTNYTASGFFNVSILSVSFDGINWIKFYENSILVKERSNCSGQKSCTLNTIIARPDNWYHYKACAESARGQESCTEKWLAFDSKGPASVRVTGMPLGWTSSKKIYADIECNDITGSCDMASYRFKIYSNSSQPDICPTNYDEYSRWAPLHIVNHAWVCAAAKGWDNVPGFSSAPEEFKVRIKCNYSSDCNLNHWIELPFCQNNGIWQKYREYECKNPGTDLSYCESNDRLMFVQECAHLCYNGVCVNPPIKCVTDSDCGADSVAASRYCSDGSIYENYRTWACNNPGTNDAYCSYNDEVQLKLICDAGCLDGKCISVTCNDDSDCGYDKWIGMPYCNGDDIYQKFRTWNCVNAGTADSYCDYSDNDKLKEPCAACSGGVCVDENNSEMSDIEVSYLIMQTRNPTAGNPVTLAFKLKNKGYETVNDIEWELKSGGTIIRGAVQRLSGGQSIIIMRKITYQGPRDYNAVVDPDNKITESNEENNQAVLSITIN